MGFPFPNTLVSCFKKGVQMRTWINSQEMHSVLFLSFFLVFRQRRKCFAPTRRFVSTPGIIHEPICMKTTICNLTFACADAHQPCKCKTAPRLNEQLHGATRLIIVHPNRVSGNFITAHIRCRGLNVASALYGACQMPVIAAVQRYLDY